MIQAGSPTTSAQAGKTSKHSGVRGELTGSNFRPEKVGDLIEVVGGVSLKTRTLVYLQWNPVNTTIFGLRKCGRNNGVVGLTKL